jgi:hypothetical protein
MTADDIPHVIECPHSCWAEDAGRPISSLREVTKKADQPVLTGRLCCRYAAVSVCETLLVFAHRASRSGRVVRDFVWLLDRHFAGCRLRSHTFDQCTSASLPASDYRPFVLPAAGARAATFLLWLFRKPLVFRS